MENNNILSWDEYFMNIAVLASLRSKDSTKVGAILSLNHKIVGVGYNGFPTGVDESKLPTSRVGELQYTKYAYTLHAEVNAILNTTVFDITGASLFNDLESAAFMLNEEIENTMLELRNNGFEPHMSGSGSAVFSIIEPETEIDEELYISCETVESGIKIIDKNF